MRPDLVDIYYGDDTSGNFFHDLAAAGVKGVAVKSRQGSFVDPSFTDSIRRAVSVGLLPIAYEFLVPDMGGLSGAKQAQLFVKACAGLGPIVLALDYESPSGITFDNVLWDAIDEIAQLTGKHPLDYGSDLLEADFEAFTEDDKAAGLWVARYSSEPPIWAGDSMVLWQFTDQGEVGGHSPLDLSMFIPSAKFPTFEAWHSARSVSV